MFINPYILYIMIKMPKKDSEYTMIPMKKTIRDKLKRMKKLKDKGEIETYSDVVERLIK